MVSEGKKKYLPTNQSGAREAISSTIGVFKWFGEPVEGYVYELKFL
jgi:hypothetical protein